MIHRAALFLIQTLLSLTLALVVLTGLALWWVACGPVALDPLAPYLTQALESRAGVADSLKTEIASTLLRWQGLGQPLELFVQHLRVRATDGREIAHIPELTLGLSLRALILGRLPLFAIPMTEPTQTVTDHPGLPEISAEEHQENGAIRASVKLLELDLGSLASLLPELSGFSGSTLPLSGTIEAVLGTDFSVQQLKLALDSAGTGRLVAPPNLPAPIEIASWSLVASFEPKSGAFALEQARLELSAPKLALNASGQGERHQGRLHLALTTGPSTSEAELTLAAGATGSELVLTIKDLLPAALAELHESLAPLAAAAVPLSGRVCLTLDPAWSPGQLTVDLALAAGRLDLPASQLSAPVAIASGSLRLSAQLATGHPFSAIPEQFELQSAALNFGGPQLLIKGEGWSAGDSLALRGRIRLVRVPATSLDKLWPASIGPSPRQWAVENITAGLIDEAWIGVEGTAPHTSPLSFRADKLEGGLAGSNLTVNYFKTLPPIIGIAARGGMDGKTLSLVTSGGRVLDMPLGEAHIIVSKLDTPQEWMDIDAPLSGTIRSALRVLDTPPLGYARKVGIDPARTGGHQSARLYFRFPLRRDITIENVEIKTHATLRAASAENVAGGVNVSAGELKLNLDNSAMVINGTAKLDGIPATVQWREAFDDNAEPQTRLAVKGELSEQQAIERAPLLLKGRLTGPVGADVVLVVNKHKKSTFTGQFNLARSQLTIHELNWKKPVGTPGNLRFILGMDKTIPARPVQIWWDAAGLKVTGTGSFDTIVDGIDWLKLSEVKSGANDYRLELKARLDRSFEIALDGNSLDARPFFTNTRDEAEKQKLRAAIAAKASLPKGAATSTAPGLRYDLALKTAKAVTGDQNRSFSWVKGALRSTGTGWDTIVLDGSVTGSSAGFSLRYLPEGANRRLALTGDDAGAALRALGFTDSIRGGQFSITGSGAVGIPANPVSAKIELGEFKVVNAPLLAQLLHALSITGLLELLNGEGLVFSQLIGDITWHGDTMTFTDVRTSGGALGLTANGPLYLAADGLAIEGTIVPLYGINRVLGLVPFLGDLLSGGKGQGLFAATFQLYGRASQPDVSVNPLAVLAPGLLRNLLFLD